MKENEIDSSGFNRRDFLRGGSMAALMTFMGGVELFAQTNAAPPGGVSKLGFKVKVGIIGLGTWGREILKTMVRLEIAEVAAICDKYAPSVKRASGDAPNAEQVADYKKILENKEIKAVVIATPTHLHKELVIEALKAGKHVYCEAPLAHTIEDAKAIAAAAKAAPLLVFQPGLQLRSDPQRHFMLPFISSGALGPWVMARAQWNKKQSWRNTAPKPEREKELNWRLEPDLSLGMIGELGCNQLDQAAWFFNSKPKAIEGSGIIAFWKDGREVADTVQATIHYSNGVFLNYSATLANSFDSDYEMFYGSDSAVMLRGSNAWLFKEVDSPLLGWEVYTRKENFYKETGIVIKAGASKSAKQGDSAEPESPYTNTPLSYALGNFLRNSFDVATAAKDFTDTVGDDDQEGLIAHIAKVNRQPAADYLEGLQATVTAIKAAEAVKTGKRVELAADLFTV
jgi:predicted dehydrogenase